MTLKTTDCSLITVLAYGVAVAISQNTLLVSFSKEAPRN
jgi:hypothetical protein